jgi:hypothetical protein
MWDVLWWSWEVKSLVLIFRMLKTFASVKRSWFQASRGLFAMKVSSNSALLKV